jgi:hypothetical protein
MYGERSACVVLDIDGVLADVRHRLTHLATRPKDWDAFFAAAPRDDLLAEGANFAAEAAKTHDIVYLTGRPERTRADTDAWLKKHRLPEGALVMRREGDRRPAVLVKIQALRKLRETKEIALVVDDDTQVVEAVRAAGFKASVADWMPRDDARDGDGSNGDVLVDAQEREGRT